MANITRTNISVEQKRDVIRGTTTDKVPSNSKNNQVVIDDSPKVGCCDPKAMNYCSDCIGCYNDNHVTVKSITSCCEYPINKCKWDGSTNVCIEHGSYFGKVPNLTTAILNKTLCNSGQTCCNFLYEGEYRGDYNENSELGVCSDYNPDYVKEKQIGFDGGYGSIEAFYNAITDGIMCNCFSSKPTINKSRNYGQINDVIYNKEGWPEMPVEKLSYMNLYTSDEIKNHPPNLYVDLNICGYPKNINALRQPTPQIEESTSKLENNTYNNFYGETPEEILKNGYHLTLTLGGLPKKSTNCTIPNNVPENTEEFNNGLKAGNNIITINCANGKQIIYKVCVPHQTTPYESNMWRTEFFNCDVDASPQIPQLYFNKRNRSIPIMTNEEKLRDLKSTTPIVPTAPNRTSSTTIPIVPTAPNRTSSGRSGY